MDGVTTTGLICYASSVATALRLVNYSHNASYDYEVLRLSKHNVAILYSNNNIVGLQHGLAVSSVLLLMPASPIHRSEQLQSMRLIGKLTLD